MTVLHRILAASFSLLVALVALEVGLRVYVPAKRPFARPDTRLLYRPEPGVAHHYNESAANGGGTVVSQRNSAGYRGPLLGNRVPGVTRIAFFGDSFVHAVDTPLADTLPERLIGELGAAGVAAETINAAVMGYGPDQELVLLREQLDEMQPDVVVLAICAHNDLGDLLRNKLFRISEGGELEENEAQLLPRIHEQYARAVQEAQRLALVRAWNNWRKPGRPTSVRDFFAPALFEKELALRRREYTSYITKGDNSVFAFFADGYEADVALVPQTVSARYKVQLAALIYAEIARECRARGVGLVLLVIPSRVDAVPDFEPAVDRTQFPRYRRAGLSRAFESMGTELGIPTLNLFDAMQRRGASELYKFGQDIHWNRAGQALAAGELAQFLRAEGLVPSSVSSKTPQ